MLNKKMWQGTLVAALLAAASLPGTAHAAGQAVSVDPDAAAACRELGDDSRVRQCLDQLPPLSQSQQRARALMEEPAVQAAMDAWSRDLEAAIAEHARVLASKGDARSLMGAMLIMPTGPGTADAEPGRLDPQAREWFARARELSPSDPLVAWVELVDCHALACDRDAALDRLLRVDGDNAAVHLWALDAAFQSGNSRMSREHLRQAASARRYDPHTSQLLGLLLDARGGMRPPVMDPPVAEVMALEGIGSAEDAIAVESIAQWAAIALGPLQGVERLCGPDSPGMASDNALRRDCVAVYSMLAEDDSTLLYSNLGARRLESMDPANAGKWAARVRQMAWLQEQGVRLFVDATQGKATVPSAEYAGWLAADGELRALSTLLERAGIPSTPPSDWRRPEQ